MLSRPKLFLLIAAFAVILVIGLALYQTKEEDVPLSRGEKSIADLVEEASTAESVDVDTPTAQALVPEVKNIAAVEKGESLAEAATKLQEPDGSAEKEDAATPFSNNPAVRGQETIKIDPPMREIGQAWLNDEERSNFSMPVTGGRDLQIEVERFESIGGQAGEFIGSVKGLPGSSVRLSYRGTAEAGTIRIPSENRSYHILPGKDGAVIVQERDLNQEESAKGTPPFNAEIPPAPDFIPPPPTQEMIEKIPELLE